MSNLSKILIGGIGLALAFLFSKKASALATDELFISNLTSKLQRNGNYKERKLSQISGIIVHHSASENQDAYDYAKWHVKHNKWAGIGYHYVIQPNGNVYQTNELTQISHHTAGHNTANIGICVSGHFDKYSMTSQQQNSLIELIKNLKSTFNIHRIKGHNELANTQCPGKYTNMNLIRKLISN